MSCCPMSYNITLQGDMKYKNIMSEARPHKYFTKKTSEFAMKEKSYNNDDNNHDHDNNNHESDDNDNNNNHT